ncbi:MAG: dephospho-CoA kinase [Candidatus Abyssubacteria bacterium]
MMVIGLTGGIATGKSSIAAMFARRGAYIIDFDELAHLVVEPDKPAWQDIVDFFGSSILKEDRTLDRPKLGQVVFSDAEKRKTLQQFIYPRISEEYLRRIQEIGEKDPDAVVLVDVPLLIEQRMQPMFAKLILVYAPRELQLKRLTERDGLSLDDALKRLDAQMPIDEKVQYADYVVHNTGSLQESEAQVDQIWRELRG